MTTKEFEDYLIITRAKLSKDFADNSTATEFDVYTKLLLDYQDQIFAKLFDQLNNINANVNLTKSKLLEDNRERFQMIMDKLNENSQ